MRTFQRQVKDWWLENVPSKEVFFTQETPSEVLAMDWTNIRNWPLHALPGITRRIFPRTVTSFPKPSMPQKTVRFFVFSNPCVFGFPKEADFFSLKR
jgi:hypothetical protein